MSNPPTYPRRAFLRRASGLVLAIAGGLVARPRGAEAAHYCGYQFGPIHQWIAAYGIDPRFMHDVVWRESNFDPSATNPSSGAAGLAQFMPYPTWAWGQERFGIYGSPYDWVTNLTMFNAFLAEGEYQHWACWGQCVDVPH